MRETLLSRLLARPVTVLVLLATLLVVGGIANARIPRQLVPGGIVSPVVSVMIPVPESTPREVMERVAIPAEELIRTIPGIRSIRSTSRGDFCRLQVEYSDGADADVIYADLRDRMERLLPDLPEGADRYQLFRFNLETDLPVLQCAVTYPEGMSSPQALLENVVVPRLEALDGVARVEVQGLLARQVSIELIPDRVMAHGVDVMGLIQRLRGENLIAPGGALEEGGRRALLRVTRRFESLDEIRAFRVDDSLLLGDIAEVLVERGVRDRVVRVDGKLCHILRVSKDSDANAVSVCRRLNEVFGQELARDPRLAGFEYKVFFDSGKQITASLSSLRSTCMTGGLLAVLVLLAFLRRWRATLVVAAAIPLSLLIAIVATEARGGTLNILSMMGLTIAMGMLIDNAIVVSESIFRRRDGGERAHPAATRGAGEVALAVTLATLTTVAVFVPLIFMGADSIVRRLMAEVGLPICASLLGSLLVALVFIPTGTVWLCPEGASGGMEVRPPGRVRRGYRRALVWILRHRFAGICLFLLFGASLAIPKSQIDRTAQQGTPSGDHYVSIEFPRSISLAEADELVRELTAAVEPLREELHIETVAAWFGSSSGTLACFLREGHSMPTGTFHERLRPCLPEQAGVELTLEGNEGDREVYRVEAVGRDPAILARILREVAEDLRGLPGVLEVITPADESEEEIAVVVERDRAQRFSISADQVSSMVGWMLRGAPLPDFEIDGEELPMWIRFQEQEGEGLGELTRVEMFTPDGKSVPLNSIARFETGRSLPAIRRSDRQVASRLQVVFGSEEDQRAVEARIAGALRAVELPEGYTLGTQGGSSQLREDLGELARAGAVGLLLIFIIMGVLFESLLLPLAVLCSVPFLFVGAFWSIWLFDETVTVLGGIGFVILLGVVVNNAIVLVDCVHRRRREGARRSEAILNGAEERFRPIWMTALTTISGLLPLILVPHEGGGFDYRPLAVIVLGGLAGATMLTLLAVPLFYVLFDDLGRWGRALLRGEVERWSRRGGGAESPGSPPRTS